MDEITHPFEPVYDHNSKILILGTMPSVFSRKEQFYYGHPQNRFWKVLAYLFHEDEPKTIEDKRMLLLREKIALWDVLKSCQIELSKDNTIKKPVANSICDILAKAPIKAVFTNGKKADELYRKFCLPDTGMEDICLPSTSPANAQFTIDKLVEEWAAIKLFLD